MAKCEICALNPNGMMSFSHCLNNPPAQGCKGCIHKCTNEAFYIGGKNICTEHLEAFKNRMTECWNKSGTAIAEY